MYFFSIDLTSVFFSLLIGFSILIFSFLVRTLILCIVHCSCLLGANVAKLRSNLFEYHCVEFFLVSQGSYVIACMVFLHEA
jgi:hypothetical protein